MEDKVLIYVVVVLYALVASRVKMEGRMFYLQVELRWKVRC